MRVVGNSEVYELRAYATTDDFDQLKYHYINSHDFQLK